MIAQLDLFSAVSALHLPDRLYAAGLDRQTPIVLHANRRVLVSLTPRSALRVHRGYAAAPDRVIVAIAEWARPDVRRKKRLEAQRVLAEFPVHAHVPESGVARKPAAPRPGDEQIFARLQELHDEFNRAHFDDALGRVRIGLSTRMRRRLGEFRLSAGGSHEIVIGRRHLRRDGWKGVAATLLHEMVHQWQAETGRRLSHGREFKKVWMQVCGGATIFVVD